MFSNLLVGVRTLLLRALKNRSIHHSQNTKILLERKREGEKKKYRKTSYIFITNFD